MALYIRLSIAVQGDRQQIGRVNRQSIDNFGQICPHASWKFILILVFELRLKRRLTPAKKQAIINLQYKLLASTTKIFVFIIDHGDMKIHYNGKNTHFILHSISKLIGNHHSMVKSNN